MAEIPSEFLGKWTYTSNENFDKYLEAKGVPWLLRKAASMASATFEITKIGDGKYHMEIKSSIKSQSFDFTPGVEFNMKAMDGKNYRCTYTVEGEELVDTRYNIDDPNDPVAVSRMTVTDGQLTQNLTSGEASCKRFFKKA